MNNHTARFLVFALFLASVATASTLDVTNNSQVTLGTNDSLLFSLSAKSLTYPSGILILLGGMPFGGPVAPIPGTSGVYMPGILFNGSLESQDGSISIPLTDSNATHVGLPAGDMLLTPGSRNGGSYSGPIDLLSAAATLSSQEAAGLFASGDAVLDLHNTGAAITFGYPGSTIGSDFSASLNSHDGSQSMGARVMRVECVRANTPEPGTIGLLMIGLTIIAGRVTRTNR